MEILKKFNEKLTGAETVLFNAEKAFYMEHGETEEQAELEALLRVVKCRKVVKNSLRK